MGIGGNIFLYNVMKEALSLRRWHFSQDLSEWNKLSRLRVERESSLGIGQPSNKLPRDPLRSGPRQFGRVFRPIRSRKLPIPSIKSMINEIYTMYMMKLFLTQVSLNGQIWGHL